MITQRKIPIFIFSLLLIFSMAAPLLSLAEDVSLKPGEIVPCGKGNIGPNGEITDACDFNSFVTLIQNISAALVIISIPIAAIMFAWIGWKFLMSRGSDSEKTAAKKMAWNVLMGFIIILCAYGLVKFITGVLLKDDFNIFINQ